MNRINKMVIYLLIFAFTIFFIYTKAISFDPETLSQVSKAIAEWKLMNEDISEPQIESSVYVSSALKGMIEEKIGDNVGMPSGLSSAIKMEYVPWELRDIARDLNKKYGGNIYVVIDHSIEKAGETITTHLPYRLPKSMGGHEILSPAYRAIIKINPDKIGEQTYGQVLAHEFRHAIDALSWKWNLSKVGSEIGPTIAELNYISQINTKITSNPLRLFMAKVYDVGYRQLNGTELLHVGKASLRDPFYNFSQKWHLSQVPDVSTLPDYKFNRAAIGDFNTRIGSSAYNIVAVKISPTITNPVNYPPQNILFSTPKILTYSNYSMPRMSTYTLMSTYTPTIPSYSPRLNIRR